MTTISKLNEITQDNLGCWIDGSNISGMSFDIQLVEIALGFGYPIDVEDCKELKTQAWETYDTQVYEDLYFVANEAYDWLNMNTPDGYYFDIQDQALFLTHEDLELVDDRDE